MSIRERLSRLEAASAAIVAPDPTNCALTFNSRINDLAARFKPEDAEATLDDLMQKSPAEHFAWTMRFRPGIENLEALLRSRGAEFGFSLDAADFRL